MFSSVSTTVRNAYIARVFENSSAPGRSAKGHQIRWPFLFGSNARSHIFTYSKIALMGVVHVKYTLNGKVVSNDEVEKNRILFHPRCVVLQLK